MLGISQPALTYAVRDGRVTPNADGTIDVERARAQLAANTDLTKPRNAQTGDPRAGMGAPATGSPTPQTYAAFRAVREGINAKKDEIELRRMMGELVEKDKVHSAVFAVYRRVRDQFTSVPQRVVPLLVGREPEEMERLLDSEIQLVLEEIASWRPNL